MQNRLVNGKRNLFLILIFILLLVSSVHAISGSNIVSEVTTFIVNQQPTISDISIDLSTGNTTTNFTCDVTGDDNDSDSMTTTYFWIKDDSEPVLVMDFNRNISTNRTGYVLDLSSNNNNGTLGGGDMSNAPEWTSSGKIGGAYEFKEDFIDLPNDLGYITNVSVFAWFKSNGNPLGSYHIIIGGTPLEISIPQSGGAIRTGVQTSNGRFVQNHGSGLTDGDWHFIGFTFNGTSKRSYIDSNFVGAQPVTGTLIYSFANRRIGRFGSSSTYYLNGSIDEIRIYDRVLSPQEISDNYNLKYDELTYNSTTKDEVWSCSARVFDGYEYSTLDTSDNITIENIPPDLPVLISPTDYNNTLIDRTPNFIWNTTDDDNDTLVFDLQIFNSYVDGYNYTGITATRSGDIYNYSIPDELYTQFEASDNNYTWRVRANDSDNYSEWTGNFTFSIEDYVAIESVNVNISFGDINPLGSYDTTNGTLSPFLFQNVGNVKVDLYNTTLNPMNGTFWSSRALDTEYFQIKADNYSSNSSFNYSDSITDWDNFSESNEYIVRNLDYHNASNNFVEIDIRLLVPGDEPPTSNSKQIAFHWSAISG